MPASAAAASRASYIARNFQVVSTWSSGKGGGAGKKALRASRSITAESLPAEKSITGRSASATASRRIWMLSASSRWRWVRARHRRRFWRKRAARERACPEARARHEGRMGEMVERAGLKVAAELADFIEQRALPGTGVEADAFWRGVADIFARFAPENRRLLAIRDELQAQLDAWHEAHPGAPDQAAYQAFLREIGYLVAEPAPFADRHRECRRRGRADRRAAARRADPQRPLPAQRRQCALGQPLRRALRHRCARRAAARPAATTPSAARR